MTSAHQATDRATYPATYRASVEPGWIDYNGHLNVAYYVLLFDRALDAALDSLGLGPAYRQAHGCSVFVGEHHLVYDREVLAHSCVVIGSRVLDVDDRRLIAFQEMRTESAEGSEEGSAEGKEGRRRQEDDRRPVATCETLCVHVDLTARRAVSWPPVIQERLRSSRDETIERPARAGRGIGIARSG